MQVIFINRPKEFIWKIETMCWENKDPPNHPRNAQIALRYCLIGLIRVREWECMSLALRMELSGNGPRGGSVGSVYMFPCITNSCKNIAICNLVSFVQDGRPAAMSCIAEQQICGINCDRDWFT